MRLNAVLARVGLCSRREADTLIGRGKVSVNGLVVGVGTVIDPSATESVTVEGRPLSLERLKQKFFRPRVWMHHKKEGVLVSASDPADRPCLIPQLRELLGTHIVTIGRLDFQSQGLILLTDSGQLADAVFRKSIERVYRVRVRGTVDKEKLASLKQGITVDGIHYKGIHARLLEEPTGSNAWIEMRLREGKNREIRRICKHMGLTVNRLIRIAFGPYRLPRDLALGETMEVKNLFREKI